MHGVQVVEGIQALGAGSQFAGSLRAAEEKNADQGDFVPVEVEDIGQAMLEFGDATVGGGGTRESLVGQRMEGAADGLFVQIHHRLAIGFLVRGVLKGIQGQRIVVGRGDFFFDQAAEDAGFDGRKVEVHSNMIHDGQTEAGGAGPTKQSAVVLSRGDLLHEFSEVERRLVGFNAELRELQRETRGDFDNLVHLVLFHPSGVNQAQDIEQQSARAYGFDIYAGTTGFLHCPVIDRGRRVILR